METALKKYSKLKKSPKGDRFEEVLSDFFKKAEEKVDQLLELLQDSKKNVAEVRVWPISAASLCLSPPFFSMSHASSHPCGTHSHLRVDV